MRHSSAPSTVRPKVRNANLPIAPAFPVAECVGADHPHSAEISSPTPTIRNWAPTEVDYDDYRDVLEGLDAEGPDESDWEDYRAFREERDYHPAELDEMRIRHGVIDCYA